MTTEVKQELVAGKSAAVHPKALGIRTLPNSFTPLARTTCLILGAMGSGKSLLVEGIPRSFRINTDLRSCSSGTPKADTWPFVKGGTPIGLNGQPIKLTWTEIVRVVGQLVAMSKDPDRPYDTVILDTVDTTIALLKEWFCKENNISSVIDADPRKAYPKMAEEFERNFLAPLRAAGYGVIFTAHIIMNTQFADEKTTGQMEDLRISNTFRAAVCPPADMICRLEPVQAVENVPFVQKLPGGGERTVSKSVQVTKVNLLVRDPRLPNFLKMSYSSKFPQPWVVPEVDAWTLLEEAYKNAAVASGVSVS